MDWAKTIARRDESHFVLDFGAAYIINFTVVICLHHSYNQATGLDA